MAIIKEMLLNISSVIHNLDDAGLTVGDTEKDSFTTDGFLKINDGVFTLSYVEKRENSKVFCDIISDGKTVSVKRTGSVECKMLFESGKSFSGIYKIPPFAFDMELFTKKADSSLTKDGGEISLVYDMTIGGAKKACKMTVTARKK